MPARTITKNIYAVGYIDWDRQLFDDLEPLPEGTTYNSYLVKGSEKTVLIDTVDEGKAWDLFDNLNALGVKSVDYIVCNHAEQDHSGSLPEVLAAYPSAKVVTNKKCKDLLMLHLTLPEDRFLVVEDGQTLPIGDMTLRFVFTPWVHWPETMMTYIPEAKILFSCDFLGAHMTTSEVFVKDEARLLRLAKLYYSSIMMPFRTNVKNALAKVEALDAKIIAPSHGPVYDRPALILDAYREWSSDAVENLVLIPYTSTHGNVKMMVNRLVNALAARGVGAKPYHVTVSGLDELSLDLVNAATVVMGTPTVIMGPHPAIASVAFLMNTVRPKTKFWSVLGAYAWATKVMDVLTANITAIKPELIEPVFSQGRPTEEVYKKIDELADGIAARHKELGILK